MWQERKAFMRFAIVGSGAVGGYYGARLANAGHEVTFMARGSHLRAIRERGLLVWSPLGDFTVRAPAEEDPSAVGEVDVVVLAVKTYDNGTALPSVANLCRNKALILTLQNGVDSVDEVAAVAGQQHVIGGSAYIATALSLPGLIEQTGTHRRIVFGEAFGGCTSITPRVAQLAEALEKAGVEVEPVPDARVPLWEKFIYLAVFAGFTGAARLPIGPLWSDPHGREAFLQAVREVMAVAKAEGVTLGGDVLDRIVKYVDALPPSTRSSLLIDLQQGKRIEVEALQGSVVRRGRARGVPTPMMDAFYAVLKPHAAHASS
jgi:2-dehydropantoate 2-reductase